MALNITKLKNNPDAEVVIHVVSLGGGGQIRGFISDDISFGSSADWQSPMDAIGGSLKTVQSLMNLGGAALSSIMDSFGFGGIAQKSLRAYATTVVDYMGTNKPTFTLPLIFVATRYTDDPRIDILRLLECVYPSTGNDGDGGLTMTAPLGYTRGQGLEKGGIAKALMTPTSGFVNVKIGRWLQFPYLVVSSVETTFSKEVSKLNHAPLYAKATVSFTFIATPTYREVVGWFRGVNIKFPETVDPTKKNKVEVFPNVVLTPQQEAGGL